MNINKNHPNTVNLNQLITNIPIRRKIVDQNDRDKFEWNQWQSATKAVNNIEAAPKEKHIRNLILGTFRLEGSRLFWSMMIRVNIGSHPVTSWKFCYVIHRLLRDGHKHVIQDSIVLAIYFDQLSQFWSGVQQGYGLLSYRYCNLLISKFKFHERNPIFAGNLTINEQNNDIRRIFDDNFNLYFQLCIELFDYMEEILNLVQVIFTSLDQSRLNSMTAAGQCRLNPIIICIQDSSLLYDYIVKVLFKLHEGLSSDILQDRRRRLADQFRRLKRFYGQSSTLQYFKSLIKIPMLPENPPDFSVKEDLTNYQAPVAIVNTSASDSSSVIEDLLIDISDNTKSTATTTVTDGLFDSATISNRSQNMPDFEQRFIQVNTMLDQTRSETDDLHRTIAAKDAELMDERNHRLRIEEQLRQQLSSQKSIEEIHALDNKTSANEKFDKLLETYNQLREEHFVVLRRENESKKELTDFNQQFTKLKEDSTKKENEFNQNYEKLNNEIFQLRQTNDELQDRIQILTTERNDFQSITIKTNERIREIEHAKQSFEERLKELEDDKSRLHSDKFTFEQKLKDAEGERSGLFHRNREQEENLIDLIHEREVLEQKVIDLEETIREWAQKFIDISDKQKLMQANHENLLKNLKRQYKYSILTYCINQMHDGIDQTNDIDLFNSKRSKEYLLSQLQIAATRTKTIHDLWQRQKDSDESDTISFLNECIALANTMADIILHGKAIANLVQDINYRDVVLYCIDLYTNYQTLSTPNDIDQQSDQLLHRLSSLIEKLKTVSV
ncbi:unnamed protein product [Rotaria socialis]|uniref:ENTH domain-containing protein n=1 Tax=Rotaria socialis TaxID=392032 RepID=A0A817SXV9_9BILA|nr:unnamed protein product [Rotaria socialis]